MNASGYAGEPSLAGLLTPFKAKQLKYSGGAVSFVVPYSPSSTTEPSSPPVPISWSEDDVWNSSKTAMPLAQSERDRQLVLEAEKHRVLLETQVASLKRENDAVQARHHEQLESLHAEHTESLCIAKQRAELLAERYHAESRSCRAAVDMAQERCVVLENTAKRLQQELSTETARHAEQIANMSLKTTNASSFDEQHNDSIRAPSTHSHGEVEQLLLKLDKYENMASNAQERCAAAEARVESLQRVTRQARPITPSHATNLQQEHASHAKQLRSMQERMEIAQVRILRLEEDLAESRQHAEKLRRECDKLGHASQYSNLLEERIADLEEKLSMPAPGRGTPKKFDELPGTRISAGSAARNYAPASAVPITALPQRCPPVGSTLPGKPLPLSAQQSEQIGAPRPRTPRPRATGLRNTPLARDDLSDPSKAHRPHTPNAGSAFPVPRKVPRPHTARHRDIVFPYATVAGGQWPSVSSPDQTGQTERYKEA